MDPRLYREQRIAELEDMLGGAPVGDRGDGDDSGGGSDPHTRSGRGGGPRPSGGHAGTAQQERGVLATGDITAPPGECVLLSVPIEQKKGQTITDDDDPQTAVASLSKANQLRVKTTLANWAAHFPKAPAPELMIGATSRRSGGGMNYALFVVRPQVPWDPVLDEKPQIAASDPLGPPFEASLRLFFPGWVFNNLGQYLRSGKSGSMTPWGPFPYWKKMVSEDMVAFAVDYLNKPGAFGKAATDKGYDVGDQTLGAAGAGLKAGLSTGNVFVGAAAAVSSFIAGAFDALFGGPPDPPPWLKALLKMEDLRKAGGGDFFQVEPTGTKKTRSCKVARITERGKYTLLEAYGEVLQRLASGQNPKGSKLGLIAAAAAIGVALMGG